MELDFAELFQRLPELIEKFRNPDWKIWDTISAALAVLGTIATVLGTYIKWRNSGIRRAARLQEFLKEREDRVATARWNLRTITNRPTAQLRNGADTPKLPVFQPRQLDKQIKHRPWVHLFSRHTAVGKAISRGHERLTVAKRAIETNERELFLAHLTRGAIHDSRGEHEDALGHFNAALKLRPDDVQALEYAGLQLVLTGSAEAAIVHLEAVTVNASTDDLAIGSFDENSWQRIRSGKAEVSVDELSYLTRMLALSHQRGDLLTAARAHRAIAFAFERSTVPRPRDAVRHARLATQTYPENAPIEEQAGAWEHVGCLVYNRSPHYWQAAQYALRQARSRYAGLHPRSEAKRRVQRIDQLIASIDKSKAQGSLESDMAPPDKALLDHLMAPLKGRQRHPAGDPASPV